MPVLLNRLGLNATGIGAHSQPAGRPHAPVGRSRDDCRHGAANSCDGFQFGL